MSAATALEVGEEVLSHFWELASLESDKREAAAMSLVNEMVRMQKEHSNEANRAHGIENGKSALDHALKNCSPAVAYCMKRLFKGLTSSRKCARQGFAVAITAAFQRLDCFGDEEAASCISALEELAQGGARDDLLGQLFGLGAVLRSLKLPHEAAVSVAEQTIVLAGKKSFLREASASLLLELAEREGDQMAKVLDDSTHTREWLTNDIQHSSPEALLVALRCCRYFSSKIKSQCSVLPAGFPCPSKSYANDGIRKGSKEDSAAAKAFFTEAHIKKLVPLLRTSTDCHPRINLVWHALLALLIPGYSLDNNAPNRVTVDKCQLETFWGVLIEDDIFQSASLERKYLGFSIAKLMVPYLSAESASSLLTPKFMSSLGSNIGKKDSFLQAVAQKCIDCLKSVATQATDDGRAGFLLEIERHGGLVAKLVSHGSKDSLLVGDDKTTATTVEKLKEDFNTAAEGDVARQKWALGQLATIGKRKTSGDTVSLDIFKFFVDQGILHSQGAVAKDQSVVNQCTSLLISSLDAAMRSQPLQKGSKQQDLLADVASYIEQRLKKDAKLIQGGADASVDAFNTFSSVRHTLMNLSKKHTEGEPGKQIEALKHLTSILELHAAANPAMADAGMATDLDRVVGQIFAALGTKNKKKKQPKNEIEDEVYWADALVDIILAVLARNESPLPSAPLRDAAEKTFRVFASQVTAVGLGDLLAVIERPLDGKPDDGEDEESSAEEEDMEMDGSEGGQDGSSSDDGEEEEGEGEKTASDDVGSDDDSSEDEGMTDEHMFKLDAQLAAYFSKMQKTGADAKQLRQDMINFKLRAISCVEAFMKKCPASPLLVASPAPLLNALTSALKPGSNQVLGERLGGILRNQLPRCKAEACGEAAGEEILEPQLRRALYLASRCPDKSIQDAATAAFVFLLQATHAASEPLFETSVSAVTNDFFQKKKTRLHLAFFQALYRKVPAAGTASLQSLLEMSTNARNEYLRQEAYTLVETAVKLSEDVVGELTQNSAGMTNLIVAAIEGPFTKVQRRTAALKSVCNIAQHLQGRGSGLQEVLEPKQVKKITAALAAAANEDKKDARLARLSEFMEVKEEEVAPAVGKKTSGVPLASRSKK